MVGLAFSRSRWALKRRRRELNAFRSTSFQSCASSFSRLTGRDSEERRQRVKTSGLQWRRELRWSPPVVSKVRDRLDFQDYVARFADLWRNVKKSLIRGFRPPVVACPAFRLGVGGGSLTAAQPHETSSLSTMPERAPSLCLVPDGQCSMC